MALVNGARGIGTGWATYIPCCDVMKLIYWYKNKLTGESIRTVKPWYRGFKGDIGIVTTNGKSSMVTTGVFESMKTPRPGTLKPGTSKTDVTTIITELPIGTWTLKYDAWLADATLERVKFKGKSIKKLEYKKAKCSPESIYFELTNFYDPGVVTLNLKSSESLNNMILLSSEHLPIKFKTINDILEYFFNQRLPYYEKRKNAMVIALKEEIRRKEEEAAFILAIVEKKLKIRNIPKDVVIENMKKLELNEKLYGEAKMTNISRDEVEFLLAKKEEKIAILQQLVNMTPEQLWLNDLDEFENEYTKHYPNE
jgi:DNA topoisomerase-2